LASDPRLNRDHLLVATVIAEAAGPELRPVHLTDGQIAERVAVLERRLRQQGRPIPVIDLSVSKWRGFNPPRGLS